LTGIAVDEDGRLRAVPRARVSTGTGLCGLRPPGWRWAPQTPSVSSSSAAAGPVATGVSVLDIVESADEGPQRERLTELVKRLRA